jgi:hypothetical protein
VTFTINDIHYIAIALTDTCNMLCSYCPHSLPDAFPKREGNNKFPHDLYLKILDYLPVLSNLEYVVLTDFNEFFLTPELTTFYLPALKKRKLDYVISTNGSIYPKDIEYYTSHNPKYLIVGLQTITEKQFYDTARLKNVSFESYIDRVSKLVRFFYDNCKDTLISIEVAYNVTDALIYKIIGCSYNKEIPSLKKQQSNVRSFIKMMSEKTGIAFHEGSINIARYPNQQVLAHSSDGKVIFGGKHFDDIINFYSRMPIMKPPVCFSETIAFRMNGDVNACCIDYKNMTVFANTNDATMEEIFRQYVAITNTMRTQGSPFDCCHHCLGYNTYREKLAKRLYSLAKPILLRHINFGPD